MLEFLPENNSAGIETLGLTGLQFDWLDDVPKKKKRKKKKKNRRRKKESYAEIAFQYGVLASRYDMLSRMVELSIAANRKQLDDELLDSGLTALRRPRTMSLPEP